MSASDQDSDLPITGPTNTFRTSHNNEIGDNPADSSDSDNAFKSDCERTNRPTLAARMLNLCKEITIMLFMAVVYASLTNDTPPKISKSPAAYPFFPKDSYITDWYRGQVSEAIEQARASDIAFVMFYAPWDAASQAARKEFQITAQYMHKQVTFASINCWQPGSECKRQYSKVYKWPVLIAYPTHGRGIQYNGPLEFAHMIKFLKNICRPLLVPQRINDAISEHDAVIVGNVNVQPGSLDYAVFYLTALRFLERDPFRDTAFAVAPQKPHMQRQVHLYVWNETISYHGEWSPEALTNWIVKKLHLVSGWVSPAGSKSLSLANYIQSNVALVFFTPKNPLLEQIDYYDMLREVAYEYYNCANDNIITLKQKLIRMARMKNRVKYYEMRNKCLQGQQAHNDYRNVPNVLWTNNSIKSCNLVDSCHCFNDKSCQPIFVGEKIDHRSPESLEKFQQEEECRDFLLSQKYAPGIFERKISELDFDKNFTGLACRSNRSLTLIALDSLRYYHFAEKLGLNLFQNKDKSAAVIVNDKMESHYIMDQPLTGSNLRVFISNYTNGSLGRSLLSNSHTKSRKTHVYPKQNCTNQSERFCVRELNTDTFLPTILQANKVVVVFYYSKQCSFCNGIAYTFLTAAKALSSVDDIEFARINGDLHLLPWEYTMETYPTILFFPKYRKSESRALPKNVPVTVPNLIGFILTNVEPVLKLKSMWAICNQTKFVDDKSQCITALRIETLSIINKALKEWRSVDVRQKAQVVHKLQVLRQLHLLFAHSPNEVGQIQLNLSKLQASMRIKDEL